MTAAFERLDVLMSGSPLFWLTLTLIVFQASSYLFRRSGFFPLLNPVLVSVVLLVTVLKLSGVEYHRYMEGGRFLHFLLGPATVALAVPLYRQIGLLRKTLGATTIALLAGSLMAVASSVAIARLGGAPWQLLLSLAPKIGRAHV